LLAATVKKAVGEIVNIGGKPVRLIDMAKKVVEVVGRGSVKHVSWPVDYRAVETGDYVSNTTNAREILGWFSKTQLEEGIRATIDVFKETQSILGRLLRL